jgi:WD40 repeat protein
VNIPLFVVIFVALNAGGVHTNPVTDIIQNDIYGDPLPSYANARMGTIRLRQDEFVNAISFIKDGKMLASSGGNKIYLWDMNTGSQIHEIQIDSNNIIKRIAISPNGNTLASTEHSMNRSVIRLWDLVSLKEIRNFEGSCVAQTISFSQDSKSIAIGGTDNNIHIFDSTTNKETNLIEGHNDVVMSITYSPDGKYLASGSMDNTIRIWNAATGKERFIIKGHNKPVYSIAYSPNGNNLVSCSADKTVRIWDSASGRELLVIKENAIPASVAFSNSGDNVIVGCLDRTIHICDYNTGNEIKIIEGPARIIAVSRDGKYIAGADLRAICLWDQTTGNSILQLRGHEGDVTSLGYSPDSKTLASASWDKTIRLWETSTGNEIRKIIGHQHYVNSVAFSPDGITLASGGLDNTIRIWGSGTGIELRKIEGHRGGVQVVSFSPDGKLLVSGGNDNAIRLWNANTGDEIQEFIGHTNIVSSVAFAPDGRTLLSGSVDKTIRLWQVTTGKELLLINGESGIIRTVNFSPDGKTFVSGSQDGGLCLWETATGGRLDYILFPFAGGAEPISINSIAYSPNAKQLVCGTSQGIYVHDVDTWEHIYMAPVGFVLSVAFTSDGIMFATGLSNSTILTWDNSNMLKCEIKPTPTPINIPNEGALSLDLLYDDLIKDNSVVAYKAMRLMQKANMVVLYLRDRLKPINDEKIKSEIINQYIVNLDDESIDIRDKASEEIRKLGPYAESMLRKTRDLSKSAESHNRIDALLYPLERPLPIPHGEPLRRWRAIRVLEHIGSADAKDVLAMLEKESPSMRERQEIKATLERLNRK